MIERALTAVGVRGLTWGERPCCEALQGLRENVLETRPVKIRFAKPTAKCPPRSQRYCSTTPPFSQPVQDTPACLKLPVSIQQVRLGSGFFSEKLQHFSLKEEMFYITVSNP